MVISLDWLSFEKHGTLLEAYRMTAQTGRFLGLALGKNKNNPIILKNVR